MTNQRVPVLNLQWKVMARFLLVTAVLCACLAAVATTGSPKPEWRKEEPRDYPPSPLPDRIILTWKGDPAISQAVTWRTDNSVEEAYALIARPTPSPDFAEDARRVNAETEPLKTEAGLSHYHSVDFTDLTPNTLYAYRVGSKKGMSEWFQFRTASLKPEPFSFLYFGDPQDAILPYWSRVIRTAYADAPHAKFMVYVGDLVTKGYVDGHWGEWFEAGGWIFAMMPTIPSPGNHEYFGREKNAPLTPHWKAVFTLPENGVRGLEDQCYFVDHQGVRIISLNSNERLEEQAEWLQAVLEDNPNRWTVAAFHHPVFSSAEGRDNEDLRTLWKPILDRYAVDLVLQGHDHVYARGCDPSVAASARSPKTGTVYVVSVSGPKMYDLDRNAWIDRAAENTQLYQVIDVTPDTLHYRAMTVTGDLYDCFDLVKQPGAPNLVIETRPAGIPERTFDSTE